MHIKKHIFIFLYLFVSSISGYGQKKHAEICIDFRVNSTVIDPTYMSNAERLDELIEYIAKLHQDTTLYVTQVTFTGVASPEGSYQVNKRLAKGRMAALGNYIRSRIQIPENIVIRDSETYIPWNYLIAEIDNSDLPLKDEILSILRSDSQLISYYNGSSIDSRILALQKLDGGKVWYTLHKRYFSLMRNACTVFITREEPILIAEPSIDVHIKEIPLPHSIPSTPPNYLYSTDYQGKHIYIKTNILGLLLGVANLSVEVDLGKHWSVMLPVYYSAWNYFKSTVKFRTFGIQPEVRYWFSNMNNGFFTGVHIGMTSYNLAFDKEYRYQDHNENTPAIGGGINMGYRMPISKDKRWKMEFSIGGGVYSLHYDKFHNTPQTKDGLMIEDVKKTYWGIDQANLSIVYTLDWKKGGKR